MTRALKRAGEGCKVQREEPQPRRPRGRHALFGVKHTGEPPRTPEANL